MKTESGKDIARWMGLVDTLNEESTEKKPERKGPDPIEQSKANIEKLQKQILEQKFKLLNAKIRDLYLAKNPDTPDTEMMRFDFTDRGDYYEFTMPINVLFGPKTRKDCAAYWDSFFEACDIKVSFIDNINEAINKINNINLTMRLEVKNGKVSEK